MRRWILTHPVWFVVILAAAVRVWMLVDLPLVITNDGVMYLTLARDVMVGRLDTIPALRTPGYPVFLAGVFSLLGIGGMAVLVAQHAAGVGISAVIAAAVKKGHGGRWAVWVGGVAALSPSVWVWESYALTETLAVLCVVLAFVVALCAGARWGLAAGALLGLACLVRPSMQIMVPFVIGGWAWRVLSARGVKSAAIGAAAVVLGLGVVTGPWVVHNAQRGVRGLARGGNVSGFWWGMGMQGLLDRSYPLPPELEKAAAALPAGPASDAQLGEFMIDSRALGNPKLEGALSAWARASVMKHPGAYLRAVARTMKSQLEMRGGVESDTGWFLWRLMRDGREYKQAAWNFQISEEHTIPDEFRMEGSRGAMVRGVEWLARHKAPGAPRLGLLLAAMIAGMAFVLRRKWGEAVLVLGTGALFAVHDFVLLPHSRYGITACACWAVLVPEAGKALVGWIKAWTGPARRLRLTRRAVQAAESPRDGRG